MPFSGNLSSFFTLIHIFGSYFLKPEELIASVETSQLLLFAEKN